MNKVPMIGEPLFTKKTNFFCQHKKLPLVIERNTFRAIRLQNMSRLCKLGDCEYRAGYKCNEFSCGCLWSQHGYKPPTKNERSIETKLELKPAPVSREYKKIKAKSLRNQILNKFRESIHYREKRPKNDDSSLNPRNSVVWLMRPSKDLRDSETNIPKTNKLSTPQQKQSQKLMSHKNEISTKLKANLSSNGALKNQFARIDKQQITREKYTLQKGTKDYYNECKKIQYLNIVTKHQNQSNFKIARSPSGARYCSNRKTNDLNNFEKIFVQQQNITMRTKRFDSKQYLNALFGSSCVNSDVESSAEERSGRKCNCDLCKCKFKRDNDMQVQEQKCVQEKLREKHREKALSPSSLVNNTTYRNSSSRNICDHKRLKRTNTEIELSNSKPVADMSILTKNAKTIESSENLSKASLKVNFSESTTRLADFESNSKLDDQESELTKEKILSPKEGDLIAQEEELPKELICHEEEKEAASVTTIDDENAENATTSKSKKTLTKKKNPKKLKNNHSKKRRTQIEPSIETLKSIENVIETEDIEVDDSQMHSTDDRLDMTSLQFDDRCVSYVELQGSTRQDIKNESFSISYHKPIKYEKRKNPDVVHSAKFDKT